MKRLYIFVLLLLSTAILKAQDTIRLFSFAPDDMVGITYGAAGALSATDIIGGEATDAHGHTASQSYWQRIADSATHFNTYSTTYPGLSSLLNASYIWSNVRPPYIYADDGFMLASMYDVTFSRDQPFNVFLGFPAVAIPASTQLVEVAWQQAYAKYYDQCFVDYKVNGQWQTMEVNVTGIDVQVNSSGPSYVRYTLPATAAQEANIELRLRYYNSAQRGNAYGYGWAVDNFAVISGNPDQWQVQPEHFVDGKYNQIPQGMQIPLTWYNNVRNTGINTQTGVNVAMQHTAPSGATSTFLSQSMGNLAPSSTADTLVIDPRGFYDATYPGWFEYAPNYGLPSISPIGNNGLPTANAGLNTVQTTLSSNALNYQYDPHSYTVTTADADGAYAWGYANGVLAGGMDGFRRGYTYDGYLTNAANTTYNESGYQVRSRITTGNTLPVDNNGEPWVIRGVEMVVSPTCSTAAGTRLTPILYKMIITPHYHSTADEVATGVAEYTVTADDYTLLDTGYLLPGQYNTLRIMFPTQPVLEPNTQYYIGYRLEGDYDFSLAQNSTRFKTTGSDGTTVNRYFHQVPGMEAYHHSFKPDNYDVMVQTYRPTYDSYWWLYSGNHFDDEAPMISALVGPAVAMPTNTVTVISAHAHVWHDLRNSYPGECDTCIVIDTLPAGSDIHYTFSPKEGYRITDITLDGVSILSDCEHTVTSMAGDNHLFYNDRYDYPLFVGNTPRNVVVSTEPRPERFVTINCPASGVFVTDNLHGTDQCGTHGTYAVQMEYLFTATDGWAIDTLFIDGDTIYPYDGSRVVYTLNINDSDHIINIVAHSQSTYCEPNPTSRDGLGITGVAFGGMTNTADRASTPPFYTDFTALSGSVLPGDTVQVYITYATGYTYGTIIWVDWNQNLIFEDNEVVYTGESTNAFPTTLSATFAVPSTQATGNYRMRIAGADYFFDSYVNNGTGSPDPCATYPWGVAEDYTLTVTNDLHTHTLTFINEGGGAFSARIFGSARSDLSIHNAMQVSVPADSSCHVLIRMTSLDPLNDYYFLDSAHARLTHFYVDGVEIPLDSITHYNSTSHAYYHSYGINNIDADHTFRAVFEPWGDTVFPPTHTVSIIKEGDGYIYPSTGQYTIYEGSSVDIEMWSSPNAQLTHFYVDGGEIPLDSISGGYDSELDFYFYTYTLSNITADHTVRAVFGPWDSVPTPPTHTITFINEGGGYAEVYYNGFYQVIDTLQLSVAEGVFCYAYMYSVEPTSPYYGEFCDSTNAQLTHFYVDGVEIPLDSILGGYSSAYHYFYHYDLSNFTADHTVRAVFGPWGSVPTPPTPETHTITFINEGGGYAAAYDNNNNYHQVIDTLQLSVAEGVSCFAIMYSFEPTSPYYGEVCDSTNAQLTHFYVDGGEIPLDSISGGYDSESDIYYYTYTLSNITADHTIRAVFGPWDSVPTPPTPPAPQTYTLTLINEGGGMFYHDYNNNFQVLTDTVQLSVSGGSSVTVTAGSAEPTSPNYGSWCNPTNAQLIHFYVDGVELPLGSIFDNYDAQHHNYWYEYLFTNITADHTIRAVFGPWDSVPIHPRHTITLINEGGGYFVLDDYPVNDTFQLVVPEGSSHSAYMYSISPRTSYYGQLCDSTNAQLLHVYVDGVEIPLDSILEYNYSSIGIYGYEYVLSNITADHTIRAVFGPWETHTLTFINEGGGYFDVNDYPVNDTLRLVVPEGFFPHTAYMYSYLPMSPYYGQRCDSTNAQLTHFYVDDVEIPLDSILVDFDDSYYYYWYYIFTIYNITSDHTIRAVFGPWDSVPTPQTHTVTLINEGGGAYNVWNGNGYYQNITDTVQITVAEGSYYYVGMGSIEPTSPLFGQICDATNAQLLHFYVDGVEVPLDSILDSYDSEYLYYWYEYILSDINADHTIRAVFGPWEADTVYYSVTLTADTAMGSVSGGGSFAEGDTATISATPNAGFHFVQWSDGISDNPRLLVVTADTSLSALFEADIVYYTVSLAAGDSTMGSVSGGGTFAEGDTATLTATANAGFHFVAWSDGVTDNPRQLVVTADTALAALFEADIVYYTVSLAAGDSTMGSVSGGGTFAEGDTATLTATANAGFHFVAWSDGVTDNPRQLVVTADTALTALFEADSTQGIGNVEKMTFSAVAIDGRIHVRLDNEQDEFRVYDISGRELSRQRGSGETPAMPTGVYLVKVGILPAQKVVVVR